MPVASDAPRGGAGRLVALLVALVVALVVWRVAPVAAWVAALVDAAARLGPWGPVLYVVVYVAATSMLFPGSWLTIAAGLLFGVAGGTVTITIAATTTAMLGFLFARHVARDAVERRARRYPVFAAIDSAIAGGGWRIVALLRLSLFPFSLTNYLCGLSAIRFAPYAVTSAVAMVPVTVFYVTIGHAAGAAILASRKGARSPGEWAMLVVGVAATGAVLAVVARSARKALRERAG